MLQYDTQPVDVAHLEMIKTLCLVNKMEISLPRV